LLRGEHVQVEMYQILFLREVKQDPSVRDGTMVFLYLCTYVCGLGKIYCLLESGYKVGTYRTPD
jgi:hypothetical protein